MSYSMHLGILYDKTPEELKALREKHQWRRARILEQLKDNEYEKMKNKAEDDAKSIQEIDNVLEEKRLAELKRTLVVTDEHRKLLANMWFEYFPNGGDYVFIGVEGKRPWGNSNWYHDIARILEWELPNDDLSNEQMEQANRLIEELPYALNKILRGEDK